MKNVRVNKTMSEKEFKEGVKKMHDLKKIALEEERSINGEICYILKKYIEEYKRNQENKKQ